jgi:hypothetical protein
MTDLMNAYGNKTNNKNYNVFDYLDNTDDLNEHDTSDDSSEVDEVIENDDTDNKQHNLKLEDKFEENNNNWVDIVKKNDKKLSYDETTWQYKMINNLYIFKDDGKSVLDIFNIMYLHYKYNKAKNNYYKNVCLKKLTNIITETTWENMKHLVVEKYSI